MLVYVYAICKNEQAFVDRWANSMKEADGMVVLDTGSSDRTVERLRKAGVTVFEQKVSPWRFDTARNLALSLVPELAMTAPAVTTGSAGMHPREPANATDPFSKGFRG